MMRLLRRPDRERAAARRAPVACRAEPVLEIEEEVEAPPPVDHACRGAARRRPRRRLRAARRRRRAAPRAAPSAQRAARPSRRAAEASTRGRAVRGRAASRPSTPASARAAPAPSRSRRRSPAAAARDGRAAPPQAPRAPPAAAVAAARRTPRRLGDRAATRPRRARTGRMPSASGRPRGAGAPAGEARGRPAPPPRVASRRRRRRAEEVVRISIGRIEVRAAAARRRRRVRAPVPLGAAAAVARRLPRRARPGRGDEQPARDHGRHRRVRAAADPRARRDRPVRHGRPARGARSAPGRRAGPLLNLFLFDVNPHPAFRVRRPAHASALARLHYLAHVVRQGNEGQRREPARGAARPRPRDELRARQRDAHARARARRHAGVLRRQPIRATAALATSDLDARGRAGEADPAAADARRHLEALVGAEPVVPAVGRLRGVGRPDRASPHRAMRRRRCARRASTRCTLVAAGDRGGRAAVGDRRRPARCSPAATCARRTRACASRPATRTRRRRRSRAGEIVVEAAARRAAGRAERRVRRPRRAHGAAAGARASSRRCTAASSRTPACSR